jgi:PEP-CTERM motif-containing protein
VKTALCAAAIALLSTSVLAGPAQAELIGAEVTYEYLFPDTSTIDFSLPTQTITLSTSLADTVNEITTTFTDSEIIITNEEAALFGTVAFNGPSYLFSGATVTKVTIDSASSPTFLGVPSFTANGIMVNFQGLPAPPVGAEFILDVTTASVVPEPGTWAMLLAGFGLMGFLGYRKTCSALV